MRCIMNLRSRLSKLVGHRILALNRGEKEKILTVKIEAPEEDIIRYLEKKTIRQNNPYTSAGAEGCGGRQL